MANIPLWLLYADGTLQVIGGLFVLALIVWYARARAADPLADAALPMNGPAPTVAVAVLVCFYLALLSGLPHFLMRVPLTSAPPQPGTDVWFRSYAAFSATQLVFLAIGLRCLPRSRTGPLPFARLAALLPLIALGCVLVANAQAKAGAVLVDLLYPGRSEPQHPILLAFESPAWGQTGVALLAFGAIAFVPAFEETMFRGLLLTSFWSATGRAWAANVMTAVMFGMMHYEQWHTVVPLIGFGLVLGFIRLRTGSLLACIVVHGLFNARTIALALLCPDLIRAGY